MQIKLPNIIESRFMVYLQIVGRKIYKYDSLENIRESEFKRISKFRPLPELDISSVPTIDVEEKERVDISVTGNEEDVRVGLVETLNKAPNLVTQDVGIDLDEKQLVRGSLTSSDTVHDKLHLTNHSNTSEGQINVLEKELDLNKLEDEIADGVFDEEFDEVVLEDDEEEVAFEEMGVELLEESKPVEREVTKEPEWVQFMNEVEPCTLKLDLKNIYFGYLGVAVDKVVSEEKEKENEVKRVQPSVINEVVQPKIIVEEPVQVVDKFVRRDGEDIVLYTRRLVRVSEVEVLKYFSPRELEIALERGNLLRKRGVIIFAHA
jgi:hypothetical protein